MNISKEKLNEILVDCGVDQYLANAIIGTISHHGVVGKGWFGQAIAFLINKNADGNQTKFAEMIGVSRQAVGYMLKGRMPSSTTIIRICKKLNVSSDWLLGLRRDD